MNAASERTRSLWMAEVPPFDAPALTSDLACDVAVVGAGMAGLSAAHELSEAGRKVIVLDRGRIAGGMTARTTAHLGAICDDGVSELIDLRGEDIARLFQESQSAAIDRIEAIVKRLTIDCDFRRLDGCLFPAAGMTDAQAREQLDREYDAARRVGASVERSGGVALRGFETRPALRYPNQATVHPLKYLGGLLAAIAQAGGRVFADSAVMEIEERDRDVRVHTQHGTVTAAHVVVATNSPIANRVALHSKTAPYRTYAMAFGVPKDALPDALYWDLADPYHYVRLSRGQGLDDVLIVGGADHKSGEADDGSVRFEALDAWIRPLVPSLGDELHRWSGQVLETIDYCAFIGKNPGSERVYVATGDSGQGITHGALAGLLIRDLIVDGGSKWREVYEPARKPAAAAVNYISENTTAIRNFAEYLMPGELDGVDDLKPGEGGVVRDGGKLIAACRDLRGTLHLQSAVCTHLGCHVQWNSTEQCWDCPCHGSQFAPDGAVLNAPAVTPLPKAALPARRTAKADG